MVDRDNLLGEFLRARRELTRPEDHGLPDLGRRRVPGLRREEVAILAGISAEYYVRLERGRDRHPSSQVVEALARVLELDPESTAYLSSLATPAPRAKARSDRDRVSPEILRLLDAMPGVPACLLSRHMTVLAQNALVAALCDFAVVGTNMVRHVFLDPGARTVYPDWAEIAAESVAGLRASVSGASGLDDPRLTSLVGELTLKSPQFAALWARHDVRARTAGSKRFVSAAVGEVALRWETLAVTGSPGQLLVTYFAEPGSPSAAALKRLNSTVTREAGSGNETPNSLVFPP